MNIIVKLLIYCVLFLTHLPILLAFQPSRGVLELDGVDDYAVLPLEEHGYLIPKGSREFTVEMWVYPKAQAKSGEIDVILSQQVSFGSCPFDIPWWSEAWEEHEENVYVVLAAYLQSAGAAAHGGTYFPVTLKKNYWNYLGLILKDGKIGAAWNQKIQGRNVGFGDRVIENLNLVARPKDFFLGGYYEDLEEWNFPQFNFKLKFNQKLTHFHGYIDAIQISKVARYDFRVGPGLGLEQPFEPPHRFKADRHTLALWDFDDGNGATRFSDSSSNGRTLIGKNGACVQDTRAVNPFYSLSTTWGEIKSK